MAGRPRGDARGAGSGHGATLHGGDGGAKGGPADVRKVSHTHGGCAADLLREDASGDRSEARGLHPRSLERPSNGAPGVLGGACGRDSWLLGEG